MGMKAERFVWLCRNDGREYAVVCKPDAYTGQKPLHAVGDPQLVYFDDPQAKCPTCGQVRDEAPEPFRITGPGVYRTRCGSETTIKTHLLEQSHPYKWMCANAYPYTDEGRLFVNGASTGDLIERIS